MVDAVVRVGLASAVFLKIFEDQFDLGRRYVGSDLHVQGNGFPLSRGSFRGIPFRMATIAVHGIEFRTSELFSCADLFGCFGRIGTWGRGIGGGRGGALRICETSLRGGPSCKEVRNHRRHAEGADQRMEIFSSDHILSTPRALDVYFCKL